MTTTRLVIGSVGALAIAGLVFAFARQHQVQVRLRRETVALRQKLAGLEASNETLSNSLAREKEAQALSNEQRDELLKLRGEVTLLRRQTNRLAKLHQQKLTERTSSASSVQDSALNSSELSPAAQARVNDAKSYCLGMMLYAMKNGNLFPTNVQQMRPDLRQANHLPTGTNQFDILYHGSLAQLPNPMTNGIIVIRSQPWLGKDGNWKRVYGFADGHCEIRSSADGNFSAWEKRHLAGP